MNILKPSYISKTRCTVDWRNDFFELFQDSGTGEAVSFTSICVNSEMEGICLSISNCCLTRLAMFI